MDSLGGLALAGYILMTTLGSHGRTPAHRMCGGCFHIACLLATPDCTPTYTVPVYSLAQSGLNTHPTVNYLQLQSTGSFRHGELINTTFLARALLRFVACMPLPMNHKIGSSIGWITRKLSDRNRKTVQRNLELCFPDKSIPQRKELAKQNLRETGKTITELGPFWFWSKDRVQGLITEEIGRHHLDQARALGKGVIVASPHFGAWELAGLILSIEAPIHFLYRPNRNTELDAPVIASRERFGGKCYPISNRGLAQLVRALKNGDAIAILPDQEPAKDHGVFAPFFGVSAYTMTFMNNLARKTGAPVVFTSVERLPRGQGYRMHYLKPDDDLYHEDPTRSATALNKCVEQCVETAPTQYMWNYKRFRKTPPDTPKRYA